MFRSFHKVQKVQFLTFFQFKKPSPISPSQNTGFANLAFSQKSSSLENKIKCREKSAAKAAAKPSTLKLPLRVRAEARLSRDRRQRRHRRSGDLSSSAVQTVEDISTGFRAEESRWKIPALSRAIFGKMK